MNLDVNLIKFFFIVLSYSTQSVFNCPGNECDVIIFCRDRGCITLWYHRLVFWVCKCLGIPSLQHDETEPLAKPVCKTGPTSLFLATTLCTRTCLSTMIGLLKKPLIYWPIRLKGNCNCTSSNWCLLGSMCFFTDVFMWASIIHLRLEIKDEYKPLNRACVPQIITFTNLTLYVSLSAVRNH